MWGDLLKAIDSFNYVVQRNWKSLPESTPQHNDLDLFVSYEDYQEVLLLSKAFPFVDVRTEGDGYYPEEIERELLTDRRRFNDFWIPSPKAHFLSLYYHNLVHKENDPYKDELKELFLEVYKPLRCVDTGVGYYI